MFGGKKVLQEKVQKLEEEIKALQDSHDNANNERNLHVHELQMTVSSILKENADLESEKAELEDEITSVKKAYNDRLMQQQEVCTSLQNQVEESLSENSKLQNKLDEAVDCHKQAERERAKERSSAMDLQGQLTERLEDVQNDLKLSLERNERLSAQVKKLEEDSAMREKVLNGKISSFKNQIQAQGSEINGLKQQVKVAMEISAEEKQASEDAIKVLEKKLGMANSMLEQRKSEIIKLEDADKQNKQRLASLMEAIDVEREKLVEAEKEHNRQLQSLAEQHEKQKDDAAKKFQENMGNILNELKTVKEKMSQETAVLNSELADTKNKLENATLLTSELKSSLSAAVQEKVQATELMQSVLDSKTSEVSEQLKSLEDKLNDKIEELSMAKANIDRMNSQHEVLGQEKIEVERKNKDLVLEVDKAKTACADANSLNEELSSQLEQSTLAIQGLERKVADLSQKRDANAEDISSVQEDSAAIEVVATEAYSDKDEKKIADLQGMVDRLTEELEILRLKHSPDETDGEAKAVEVTGAEQVDVSVGDQSNAVAAGERRKVIEAEYRHKVDELNLKIHEIQSKYSLEKESFLDRIKVEVLNNEKLHNELKFSTGQVTKLKNGMEKLIEQSKRKEDEIKAANKMIVKLNAALAQKSDEAAAAQISDASHPSYAIKDLKAITVRFEAGPMGIGLSPLTPNSTITIIRNLTPGQNNKLTGVEKHNTDPNNAQMQILPGMVLKQVNDMAVIGLAYKQVIDLLMKTKRPIRLVFVSITIDKDALGRKSSDGVDQENPFL